MEREPRAKRPKPTMWRFGDSMGPCLECDGRDNNDRRCRYASKEACEADRAAPLAKKKGTRWDVLSTALKRGMVLDDVPTVLEWKEDFLVADGLRLRDLSEEDRNNEALVMLAVRQNGRVLRWASDKMKRNKKVVLTAVSNNSNAFLELDDGNILLEDEEVVGAAVRQDPNLLEFSPLWKNRSWVLKAFKEGMDDVERFENDETHWNDKEVMRNAVTYDPWLLVKMPEHILKDRDILETAFAAEYINKGQGADRLLEQVRELFIEKNMTIGPDIEHLIGEEPN